MSWLSRISLAQRALIALMAVVAVVFGAIAIPSLKQQLLPSIDLPIVSVITTFQGASPDVVEKQVVEPIEDGIKGVDGITGITSTASEGSAVIMAQFDYGNDSDKLVANVQQAVNRVSSRLPEAADPQVVAGSTDDIPTVVLAATSTGLDQQALADGLDRSVVPVLQDIDGVGQVTVTGVQDQVVTVTPDDAKLARAGIGAAAVVQALQAGGHPVPAGSFDENGKSRTVQVGGEYASLDEIKDLRVPAGAKPVRLGDIATVVEAPDATDSITRTDGEPSLGIAVTMTQDGSAVAVSTAVKDKLADMERDLGKGAKLTVVSDQGPAVSKSIHGLTTEGLLGLLFAVLVILVFLASLRSTLVTALSIPLSVVLTLIVLWTRDLSLNVLTLGALTIAIGRVVDDSIVVLENIKRHLAYGEEKHSAIITAVREVSGAVTASTLTTVAVFLPIGLVGGLVGALFGSFSLTVAAALLSSLLVSLTVVPVFSYWFLKPPADAGTVDPDEIRRAAEAKEAGSLLQRLYVPVLRFATRRRITSVVIAVAVLFCTFGLVPLLKTNFFDQGDQDTLTVKQQLAPGTGLKTSDAAAGKVEKLLGSIDEVKDYQVTVGSSGFLAAFGGGTGANQASFQVRLKDAGDTAAALDKIRAGLKTLDGVGTTSVSAGGGFGSQNLSVVVKAADGDTLAKAADQVRDAVAGLDDVTDVTSDLAQSVPRIEVHAKQAEAAKYGLNDTTIGAAVTQAVHGTTVGKAVLDDTERDVRVTSEQGATTLAGLKALTIETPVGPVKLGKVADVVEAPGPVQKTRIDGARAATITATPTADNTGAVSTALQKKIKSLHLPKGATAEIGGVSSDQGDAFSGLALAMLAAVAIVFMLLVGTFRSLVQPLVLLVSIPFASTGAIGLLLITGTPLGVPALIGMLMLIGVVVTNAIVLMDLINQYRAQGYGVVEAVIEGGRHRLRPILMTALATIFALLPMALGVTGEGGFIAQPLAVVVIGGLLTSTLLTLLLVPTLYTMVELRKERRAKRKALKRAAKAGGSGAGEAEPTPELTKV
ncbi:efflux RND transporter permease subunit [Streptomyces sp. NPDC088354]|uniref:efflux RND transporter permease subunit n=1 Tax=unclassified Streptomyces TaxID=2593676 RepID=UPI0029B0834B|nr:efflux RND transporter permease subunit [Streptomyces sp. MI02-7b]MDX3075259.1 efflux RND transporter permease subunit [Streptomyces sp. MI02-7b]